MVYFKNGPRLKLLIVNVISVLLLACDAKPIDYDKRTHRASYVRASSTQTGKLMKSHPRMGISSSSRAFKNRLNSKSYYHRNRHVRQHRKY